MLTLLPAMAAEPKRVLIIHSFGSAAPPFTTHSIAFETELVQKMDARVDLDEVSLDMARYADSDMQEALVDYLEKRREKWQPDLVVPIGSPAGVFVAQNRDRLFPATPILYCGLDRRRLPPDALEKNAAFVGESFDLPNWVEDILQLAPETKNITVVLGGSSLERSWADVLRREYQPFMKDVQFTWVSDLSFDQILEQARHQPPHSFILFVLLLRDGIGVTHNADEALQRLHAVANAPINGIYQHQLGLGIVGGRLYQAELEGLEAARVAIRILHGEPASSFPPRIVGPLSPRYDWRELQRWNIDEKRLPPGSRVLFRAPTAWQQNRAWIISGVSVCLVEALLIFGLLVNLVRRRRAERSLAETRKTAEEEARLRRAQINLLSRVSLLGEMTASLAHELSQPLSAILSNASAGVRFIDSNEGDAGIFREILVDVIAATRRARDIIEDVRNAIKRGDTIRGRVNLNDVVTSVTHIVQPDAAAHFCEVQMTLAGNLPAIRGNPNQIQQVLINLVSNAFDAMSETLPTRRKVEIDTEYHGDGKVRVSVRDYGCGIPNEARERIFEQFFTTKEQGLGMGLAIVRSIIEAHGGGIEVESAEGGGARFHFHLPVSTDEHSGQS